MKTTPTVTDPVASLLPHLAHSILAALHFQAEHRRTSFGQRGRRAILQQNATDAFRQAYALSTQLKEYLPTEPKESHHRTAAALRRALHEYQGAYWAWKEEKTAENLAALETATGRMRLMAIKVKNLNSL
jgi:hypothetical protein